MNNEVNDASLSINGYQVMTDLRRDRTDTARGIGGGLLVYAKDGLTVFKRKTLKRWILCSSAS